MDRPNLPNLSGMHGGVEPHRGESVHRIHIEVEAGWAPSRSLVSNIYHEVKVKFVPFSGTDVVHSNVSNAMKDVIEKLETAYKRTDSFQATSDTVLIQNNIRPFNFEVVFSPSSVHANNMNHAFCQALINTLVAEKVVFFVTSSTAPPPPPPPPPPLDFTGL